MGKSSGMVEGVLMGELLCSGYLCIAMDVGEGREST